MFSNNFWYKLLYEWVHLTKISKLCMDGFYLAILNFTGLFWIKKPLRFTLKENN